jgi:hypothetical protein
MKNQKIEVVKRKQKSVKINKFKTHFDKHNIFPEFLNDKPMRKQFSKEMKEEEIIFMNEFDKLFFSRVDFHDLSSDFIKIQTKQMIPDFFNDKIDKCYSISIINTRDHLVTENNEITEI